MSQEHKTFETECKTCHQKMFMRWSENKSKFYPANNATGKPEFHNCRPQQPTTQPQSEQTKQTALATNYDEETERLAYIVASALKIRAAATKLVDSIKMDIPPVGDKEREIMIEHYENILTQLLKGS
mgnify:FL=1